MLLQVNWLRPTVSAFVKLLLYRASTLVPHANNISTSTTNIANRFETKSGSNCKNYKFYIATFFSTLQTLCTFSSILSLFQNISKPRLFGITFLYARRKVIPANLQSVVVTNTFLREMITLSNDWGFKYFGIEEKLSHFPTTFNKRKQNFVWVWGAEK